nr:C25 family cysteine peptidase [Candidatus Njordarchaeota archaeon]
MKLFLFFLAALVTATLSQPFCIEFASSLYDSKPDRTNEPVGIAQDITIKVSISVTPQTSLPDIAILLPPNGRIAAVRFSTGIRSVYGYILVESFFRCYKLAYFRFGGANYYYGAHDVTFVVSLTGPMMQRVEWDDVASPLVSCLRFKDCWFSNAFCRFVSSGKIDEWKAYPTFSVERCTVFTFPIYVPKIKYVAIVPEAWASVIHPLLSWKRQKGLPATYFTVEWINSSYAGLNLAARIGEFLKDAFNNWQISYVLLAGVASGIPPGNYECLDGDDDAFPDLAVGRLPAVNLIKEE